MNCFTCEEALLLEDTISCSSCSNKLHFHCGGMTEINFRKLSKVKKETWKCIDCKTKKESTSNIPDSDESATVLEEFKKLSKDLRNSMAELEKSVQFSSDQVEELMGKFDHMKSTFESMQANQADIVKENNELKKQVKDMKTQIADLEQKSLDHNLEISGVPDAIDEDRIIPLLCEGIGLPVPEVTLYTTRRSKLDTPGKPKSIFIQFESKYTRDKILKESKKAKPTVQCFTRDPVDAETSVYVNEQLSPQNKFLFYNANKIKKDKKYKFLWVSDGCILLKKGDKTKTVRVHCLEDME